MRINENNENKESINRAINVFLILLECVATRERAKPAVRAPPYRFNFCACHAGNLWGFPAGTVALPRSPL
ncbi:MAG: hypothetical protein KME26_07045 [Oscillatoria princeps RMCB-10]|nr:hypothetical protein [Oscillatoria princeps RMCB-10]